MQCGDILALYHPPRTGEQLDDIRQRLLRHWTSLSRRVGSLMKPNRPTVLNNFFLAGVFVALIGLIFLTSGCVVVDFSGEPNPDKRLAMPVKLEGTE